MWTYEFDETGGYDCMTSAFDISCNGALVVTVDCGYFEWADGYRTQVDWETAHRRSPAAEAMARKICARMNG